MEHGHIVARGHRGDTGVCRREKRRPACCWRGGRQR
jgi:hypothetical protein